MTMRIESIDELRGAWRQLERRLDRHLALDLQRRRADGLARVRGLLRPLALGQGAQLVFGLMLVLSCGVMGAKFPSQAPVAISAVSLGLYGLMTAVFAVRDLVRLQTLDYAAPVLEVQERLAILRTGRLRAGWWFAAGGCLMWTPGLVLLFAGMGVDVWARSPAAVGSWIGSSILCLGLSAGVLAWSRRPGQERLAGWLQEQAAGLSLTRAQAALDEVRAYEREPV